MNEKIHKHIVMWSIILIITILIAIAVCIFTLVVQEKNNNVDSYCKPEKNIHNEIKMGKNNQESNNSDEKNKKERIEKVSENIVKIDGCSIEVGEKYGEIPGKTRETFEASGMFKIVLDPNETINFRVSNKKCDDKGISYIVKVGNDSEKDKSLLECKVMSFLASYINPYNDKEPYLKENPVGLIKLADSKEDVDRALFGEDYKVDGSTLALVIYKKDKKYYNVYFQNGKVALINYYTI